MAARVHGAPDERRFIGISRLVLGPWPLRPALMAVTTFVLLALAANLNLGAYLDRSWREIAEMLLSTFVSAGAVGLVLLLGKRVQRRFGLDDSRSAYLLSVAAAALVLAVPAYMWRMEEPTGLTPDPRGVFLFVRAFLGVLIVHSIAGANDSRLRAQALRAERALQTVSDQRSIIIDSEERIRNEVARFLHDTVQGGLVAVTLQLRSVKDDSPEPMRSQLGSIIEVLEEMRSVDVRSASRLLSPDLSVLGLEQALSGMLVKYEGALRGEVRIDAALREWCSPAHGSERQPLAVYRMAEQAVLNAAMHGKARHVWIDISRQGDHVVLKVDDDGSGLPDQPKDPGAGTTIISAWSASLDGEWELGRRAPNGARLTVRFPMRDEVAA